MEIMEIIILLVLVNFQLSSSYECVIELPGFEYNIDKMIDGKKGHLIKIIMWIQ